MERRHLGRMAPEEEAGPGGQVLLRGAAEAERLEERGERDVEVCERLRVKSGAELDAAGGVNDLVEASLEIHGVVERHRRVPGQQLPGNPRPEGAAWWALRDGEAVTLDLGCDVRLVALDEPRAADLDVLVGSGKRPVPGSSAETVPRLENDARRDPPLRRSRAAVRPAIPAPMTTTSLDTLSDIDAS